MTVIGNFVPASWELCRHPCDLGLTRDRLLEHVIEYTTSWTQQARSRCRRSEAPAMVTTSGSSDYIGVANAPILWILALAVMGVVVVKSLLYMAAGKTNAESAGMSRQAVRAAFRAGGVAAIEPSL